MATVSTIPLTSTLNVQSGSHILYFYSNPQGYMENAISYIKMGIRHEQHTILVESPQRYYQIKERLQREITEKEQQYVHYINSHEFYRVYEDFVFEKVLLNLSTVVQPYLESNSAVRLWGHVDWKPQKDALSKLKAYESECDIAIDSLGYLTVCAYDGREVPANYQIELMKTHEYLMTDDEVVISNLYRSRKHAAPVFPSLSAQTSMESEMDLYKQKLDFVHVISHEVRNPLTVIKAYASMLLNKITNPNDREKLKAISDYVVLIDSEISHIITTEQMLTTDSLWKRSLITPKKMTEEIIEIMEVKARTQNIRFNSEIKLDGSETILSNTIGFRLIISNLVSNAIKYSEEGGTVVFRISCSSEALVLSVQDFGVGISEEQLKLLFRKYEKLNEDKSGQGIGLFMVKKLVDHFKGTIDVQSKLGVGTTVTVSLPLGTSTF